MFYQHGFLIGEAAGSWFDIEDCRGDEDLPGGKVDGAFGSGAVWVFGGGVSGGVGVDFGGPESDRECYWYDEDDAAD